MVDDLKLKIQEDPVDGWKKMKTYSQIECAHLELSADEELLRRFLDVQSSVVKSSSVLHSCVAKALDVGSVTKKSPSVGIKMTRKPQKPSTSKDVKKPAEDLSSGKDIDVDSFQANVL